MKICVFGAGAIGGVLACRLSAAGHDVSVVARGDHLAAIQSKGLHLIAPDGEETFPLRASSTGSDFGPQDLVICALKAHSLPSAAVDIAASAGPKTPILFVLNGVPWWYFYRSGGPFEGTRLDSVDPGGRIWNTIGPQRALGCIIYLAATVPGPGTVRHHSDAPNRIIVGEPDGSTSQRLKVVVGALRAKELFPELTGNFRGALFGKLLNTVSLNQVCALTRSPIDQVVGDPRTRKLVRDLMSECVEVGRALGAPTDVDIEARIEANSKVTFKPSTLQDLEAKKPLEIDALVAAISELGGMAKVPTPNVDAVYALVRRLAEREGIYPRN